MTSNFSHAVLRNLVGLVGAAILATTFVGAAAVPAQAAAVSSLSARAS